MGWGLIVGIGYFGVKVWWGNHSLGALSVAMGEMFSALYYFRKFSQKEKVLIELDNGEIINIYIDEKLKISASISNLKKMSAMHYSNTKPNVQIEFVFKEGTVDLYDVGNYSCYSIWFTLARNF